MNPRFSVRQRGAVLFVGLIMLILITLLAVSAIRLAKTNMLIAGNEQFQMEVENAADYHLDLALNDDDFTNRNVNRSSSLPAFSGANASDATSYTVVIPPATCKRYRYLKKGELVTETKTTDSAGNVQIEINAPPENLACFGSSASPEFTQVTAIAVGEDSLCATSLWEMNATATLPATGAAATVTQGVEMRIDYAEAKDRCE